MTEIIIGLICLIIGFGGGAVIGYQVAPKEINNITEVDSKTYVNTQQQSVQNTMQGQVTAILQDGKRTEYLNIAVNSATNLIVSRSTNSNTIAVTNTAKTGLIIPITNPASFIFR